MITKYIFVTGDVTSSLGKGIIAASLAKLLQARGYRVTIQKFNPYINVDPGTLNPYEHGGRFVIKDGVETDLDLGHYERFLSVYTSQANNVTTERIYQSVIEKERRDEFLSKIVQVVPHITSEIKERIQILGKTGEYDTVITGADGTVGDIESLPYIESVHQLLWGLGEHNGIVIHPILVPCLAAAGKLKTKPTQHGVKTLMEDGIQADILVCRTEHKLSDELRYKLALFCNVKREAVVQSIDVSAIYDVPNQMLLEGFDKVALKKLDLPCKDDPDLTRWNAFLQRYKNPKHRMKTGLMDKYMELQDSCKSILKTFIHSGAANEVRVDVESIHSEHVNEENIKVKLGHLDAILVAPDFGGRGIEGKIRAMGYVREHNIPFLGICLGTQTAIIEFARHVTGPKGASSTEMDEHMPYPTASLMESRKQITHKGGTMRLGAWACELTEDSKTYEAYGKEQTSERHRHRYGSNSDYHETLERAGLRCTGVSPDTGSAEMVELPAHPWFAGIQYHPEYEGTVTNPHPLFVAFVKAALNNKLKKN